MLKGVPSLTCMAVKISHCARGKRSSVAPEPGIGPEPVLPKPKSNLTEGWSGHVGCGLEAVHVADTDMAARTHQVWASAIMGERSKRGAQ
mgnify:CR=1 FL=1